jgi:hypothetical protein
MDAVMYLVGAIEKFGRMSKQGRLMSCVLVSVRCRRRLRPPIRGEPIRAEPIPGEPIPGEPISGCRYGAGYARGARLLRAQRSRVRRSRPHTSPKRERGMAFLGSIPHGTTHTLLANGSSAVMAAGSFCRYSARQGKRVSGKVN